MSSLWRGSDSSAVMDVEMANNKGLSSFFEEIGSIKGDIDKLHNLLSKLHDANESSKAAHKASEIRSLRSQMQSIVSEVLGLARSIKSQLERLDASNSSSRLVKGCGAGSPTDRTRMALTQAQRSRLKTIMAEFSTLRDRINDSQRGAVKRRYYTITGEDASDETIDHIVETGQSESILQRAVQQQGSGGRLQILDTVEEIQARHDAAKAIEKSLLELQQIFLDLAVLVDAQGEMLDTIQNHVEKARSFVDTGRGQLEKAKRSQRSSRKWSCIAIIILLIIILIIVLPIVLKK